LENILGKRFLRFLERKRKREKEVLRRYSPEIKTTASCKKLAEEKEVKKCRR